MIDWLTDYFVQDDSDELSSGDSEIGMDEDGEDEDDDDDELIDGDDDDVEPGPIGRQRGKPAMKNALNDSDDDFWISLWMAVQEPSYRLLFMKEYYDEEPGHTWRLCAK